jgi:hypothetical protein
MNVLRNCLLQAKPVNSYMLPDQATRYPKLFLILPAKKCRSPASNGLGYFADIRSNDVGRPEQL